jgi:Tfp pilus assembly protein PilX
MGTRMHGKFQAQAAGLSRARGLALVVALIALAAMSLAAIWLVRLVDTNVSIASNLAFRQSATLSAGKAAEAARTWLLQTNAQGPAALDRDLFDSGYAAQKQAGSGKPCGDPGFDGVDFMGNCSVADDDNIKWKNADGSAQPGGNALAPQCGAVDEAGSLACWVIHRMCSGEGNPDTDAITCDTVLLSGLSNAEPGDTEAKSGNKPMGGTPNLGEGSGTGGEATSTKGKSKYYRVTVRVSGPRENAAYTQTFLVL